MIDDDNVGLGAHERQLKRRMNNPLFPRERQQVGLDLVVEAQARDEAEREAFIKELQSLVQTAVELKPNEESEVILKLKEDLDRAYETCSGIAGEQADFKQAIRQLIDVVMRSIWANIGNDVQAVQELERETAARQMHFQKLNHPLVADLLRPDTTIAGDELVPTLLSEPAEAIQAAWELFDPEQQSELRQQAEQLLERLKAEGENLPDAWEKLPFMRPMVIPAAEE